MTEGKVQTRDGDGELRYFDSLQEAFDYAENNPSVWKVSFAFGDERARFERVNSGGPWPAMWEFRPLKLWETLKGEDYVP